MRRFLIADDNSVVRKGLRQILFEAFPSAIIEEVTNAEDLLKRAIKEEWDVVISDYSLPSFSGLAALELTKSSGFDIPFLIVSGVVG